MSAEVVEEVNNEEANLEVANEAIEETNEETQIKQNEEANKN